MYKISFFADFSDKARLWIYGFTHPLSVREKRLVSLALDNFLKNWNSHGNPINGGTTLLYDQFVIIAANIPSSLSGCAIDASVSVFKRLRREYKLDALNLERIFYRADVDAETIHVVERSIFQQRITKGEISTDKVIVFDTLIQSLEELRQEKFEIPFSQSWHQTIFKL